MSEMVEKLRKHLQSISQEKFEKEWAEIEKLGLKGPTIEEQLSPLYKYTDIIKANAEKSALLRLNSNAYFTATICHRDGKRYSIEAYIYEVLNPIIESYGER